MHTHYHSSSKGPILIEDMHSEHLRQAAAKIRREGGELSLAEHMEKVAHRKERDFHDCEPDAFEAWAVKYPEKAKAFRERHGLGA